MPTVLILSASPTNQARLRLGAEVKSIEQGLQRSQNRENWKIVRCDAATVDDLRRALLDTKPTILHFSGHGDSTGLCFENDDGKSHIAGAEPLARLLHLFKVDLKCVVLNSCWSQSQAEVIRKEIDVVIGMSDSIADDVARKFAVAFYDGIFAGVDFRPAFDLATTAIDLAHLPQADVPKFLTGQRLGNQTLEYGPLVPVVERLILEFINTPYAERAALTTSGDSILGMLRQFYGDQIHQRIDAVTVDGLRHFEGNYWEALVTLKRGSDHSRQRRYAIHVDARNVLLEWEATVGNWSVPPKTYENLGSDTPIVARAMVELDSDYDYDELIESAFQSMVICNAIDNTRLCGWIHRGNEHCKEILDILKDGKEHRLTLELRPSIKGPKYSIVNKLLSKTWLYHPRTDS